MIERDNAETIALKALEWLASDEELLPVFLGATGTTAEDLRSRAADSEYLGAVLDFILMDDNWVMAFCGRFGLDYSSPMQARLALPGGAQMHWT